MLTLLCHLGSPWWLQISNSTYCTNVTATVWDNKERRWNGREMDLNPLCTQEPKLNWQNKQNRADGNTNDGRSADTVQGCTGKMEKQSRPGPFVSHLVVWVERAAVNIVIVAPEHSDQRSCVEGVHCHWAATWHKHKLWAAAAWHCKL